MVASQLSRAWHRSAVVTGLERAGCRKLGRRDFGQQRQTIYAGPNSKLVNLDDFTAEDVNIQLGVSLHKLRL
jgi:hypothetical protein